MEKQEYRILVKHGFLIGKTRKQLLFRATVYWRFGEFKMNCTRTEHAPHSVKVKEVMNAEIIDQVNRFVLKD